MRFGATIMDEKRPSVAEQRESDMQFPNGGEPTIEGIKNALVNNPPQGEMRRSFLEQLLKHSLDSRDADASVLVARFMDEDPALDEYLNSKLNQALETQPDSVYAFARSRLNAIDDLDEHWLARLKLAAQVALEVAISDGDTETLNNWLKLIAREPAKYNLGEVLHNGILAAQPRAHQDGELGRQLILLAAKRDPEALDFLLNDERLLAILPGYVGQALRDYQGDAMALLQNRGPEIFLMALARAAQIGASALFTPACIAQVWAFSKEQPLSSLPDQFQATTITQQLVEHGAQWLENDALETLVMLVLNEKRDDLFQKTMADLSRHRDLMSILISGLDRSQRPPAEVAQIANALVTNGFIDQQQAVEIYIALLNLREWRKETLPLMEQIARSFQQYPTLSLSAEYLWRLMAVANEVKSDVIARSTAKRLLADIETLEDEKELVEAVVRLYDLLDWNPPQRQNMLNWWRGFARSQPLNRLQRIDKSLDGKRALEEAREAVQTIIAFRKMLGKRTLREFADEIDCAFTILQNLAESFDPNPKHAAGFDQASMRGELEARDSELSPSARKIFANNLKEMAQLIGAMGDNRSKANLMRRGDNVDRQLMSGGQQPDSAVDVMKWLAGYLEGSQGKEDESEN